MDFSVRRTQRTILDVLRNDTRDREATSNTSILFPPDRQLQTNDLPMGAGFSRILLGRPAPPRNRSFLAPAWPPSGQSSRSAPRVNYG